MLRSRLPGDPGDPVLNTWILWWNAQAVPFTDAWWNAPFMFPLRDTLALSEHLLGLSVIATPMQLGGASPLFAYNVLVILSFTLSGFFAYLLAYRLTGSLLASLCAGVAFGFAPYRAGQLSHVQVLTSQWMPLMLLGMHGYATTARRSWLALFGASWLLQSLSNGYYMLFLPALIVPWIAWFTPWRTAPGRAAVLIGTWAVSSLPLLPLLLRYHAVHTAHGLARTLDDVRQFSASARSFVSAPPLVALWPAGEASQEGYLFPGLTVVVVALAGVLASAVASNGAQARRCILFYGGAAVLMYAFALGPGGSPGGPPSLVYPYSWLLRLPGYDSLRVPARFAMPGTLCLALAAACGLAWLLRDGTRWRAAIALVVLGGIAADGFTERIPTPAPPPRIMLPDAPGAAVIEIPTDDPLVSAGAMYRGIYHGRPLVNGYTGHTPHHYGILSLALWRGDTSVLDYFAQDRPLVIVVNDSADRGGGFRRMIEAMPTVRPLHVSGAGPVFLLPRASAALPTRSTFTPDGAIPAQYRVLDARAEEAGRERIQIDLGEAFAVSAIAFDLRDREEDLAGRLLVEASDDGAQWREVWLGWTGALALDAALRDPKAAPVRIAFRSVLTRYLRVYPAPPWLLQEVKVIGS